MNKIARARQRIGATIGERYRLLDVLGVGGTGAVYLAEHVVTEERFALKVLAKGFAESDPSAVERFVREARAAAQIKHPGVVKVFDAASDAQTEELFLAMELLEGEELTALLDRGHTSAAEVIRLVVEVLGILAAVHERGIVHRDVKPSNVFIARTPDGRRTVKLLDFGVARHTDQSKAMTIEGSVLGTPWYMSPEQAAGKPVGVGADIWSVGAMLFHLLAGRPPFDGPNANVVISMILTQEAPSLRAVRADLPASVVQAVDRALRRDVAQRWPSAEAMAEALRTALPDAKDVSLRPGTLLQTPSSEMRWTLRGASATTENKPSRRRLVYGSVGAAALLAAGVLGVASWTRSHATAMAPAPTAATRHAATSPTPEPRAVATTDAAVGPAPSAQPEPALAPATTRAPRAPAPAQAPRVTRTAPRPAPSSDTVRATPASSGASAAGPRRSLGWDEGMP